MPNTLIVARMAPQDAPAVARIFADSDATALPAMLGVRRRALFRFRELYFHLIETDDQIGPQLDQVRRHPLFTEVNERLAAHITPYAPDWRSPSDAMAEQFYGWQRAPQPATNHQEG